MLSSRKEAYRSVVFSSFTLALVGLSGHLQAVEDPAKSIRLRVGDESQATAVPPVEGTDSCHECFVFKDPHHRAGYPSNIAWYARCSVNRRYGGYYVGGDTAWFGCGRGVDDGTWGLDFIGGLFQRRVWLNFSHGRRYQGGTGAYRTDGPHILKSLSEHE